MNIKIKKYSYKTYSSLNYFFQMWFNFNHLFFNSLIFKGKKFKAYKVFENLRYKIKNVEKLDPFLIISLMLVKIVPKISLSSVRLGSLMHELPTPITDKKQITLVVRWLLKLIRRNTKSDKTQTIVSVILDSYYDKGIIIEKKKLQHESGIKNRHLIKYLH